MFNKKINKLIRDPNLFLRDFFAKRVKSGPILSSGIDVWQSGDALSHGGRVNSSEAYFFGLPFEEGVNPWVQMARQLDLRTGATNGQQNQSLVVNSADLVEFLFYAMFLAARMRAGLRVFTLGGAVNRRYDHAVFTSPQRARAVSELYDALRTKPDFCVEFLADGIDAFVAHTFLYDIVEDGIRTMRSDKSHMRRATAAAFDQCYPRPDTTGGTWAFHTPVPVDVVYTWVNRDDAGWQELWHSAFLENAISADRYSSKDELRYSLRSIRKFMPWHNNIHIVSNCRKPDWLGNDPRIRWVSHEDVFPVKDVLPSFNSHAIEASLHKIEGITEHFVYFNDDFFVTHPVYPEDFFDDTGRSIARLEPYGTIFPDNIFDATRDYLKPAINSQLLIASRHPGYRATRLHTHTPYALRVSVLEEIEEFFGADIARTRSHRKRTPADVNLVSFFYHHYALATGHAVTRNDPTLIVRPQNIGTLLKKKMVENYKFLCFNDGDGSADDQNYLNDFVQVMNNHFGHRCILEAVDHHAADYDEVDVETKADEADSSQDDDTSARAPRSDEE